MNVKIVCVSQGVRYAISGIHRAVGFSNTGRRASFSGHRRGEFREILACENTAQSLVRGY